jgi:hypothetical protein
LLVDVNVRPAYVNRDLRILLLVDEAVIYNSVGISPGIMAIPTIILFLSASSRLLLLTAIP